MREFLDSVGHVLERLVEDVGVIGFSLALVLFAVMAGWLTHSPWAWATVPPLAFIAVWLAVKAIARWIKKKYSFLKVLAAEDVSTHTVIASVGIPALPDLKWPICCLEPSLDEVKDLALIHFLRRFRRGAPVCVHCNYVLQGFPRRFRVDLRCPECGTQSQVRDFGLVNRQADAAMRHQLEKLWRKFHPDAVPFP